MTLTDRQEAIGFPDLSERVYSLTADAFFGDDPLDPRHLIHSAFLHHYNTRGCGARARMAVQCASLLGLSEADAVCIAATVECLHNASLVQDDLQDKALVRREQRSVASRFGEDVALGLTDRLITSAFVCLSNIGRAELLPKLIRKVNRAVSQTVDGQTTELCGKWEPMSVEARLSASSQKSGPLFALALELPLILGNHPGAIPIAHKAACQFGLGYQIWDDLKDQEEDAASSFNGNLVLAMRDESPGDPVEIKAARLARQVLCDAAEQAGRLPSQAGQPLIELVDRLLLQIDEFCS